jgi:putative ATP-dependent endonuclease of the OLD family
MRLTKVVIKGFQSFGPTPTTVELDNYTFLIGPNGTGKTAVLQALSRLFGYNPEIRKVRPSDFHRPMIANETADPLLWIEAHFDFPETASANDDLHPSVPVFCRQMALVEADGVPKLRIRLTATIDDDELVEETVVFVTELDEHGEPATSTPINRHDRSSIQVHYLPARRDPADHIRYAITSLLGRLLRSADWSAERATLRSKSAEIADLLAEHAAVAELASQLDDQWTEVHSGSFFAKSAVAFDSSELEVLMRQLTVRFGPSPAKPDADFSLLSDGQQSLLYISLVLAVQAIGRRVLAGEVNAFDPDKLRPPVFALLAVEEPENSLSPHHLGRVLAQLKRFVEGNSAQVVLATHSPSLLRRVPPENIRHLRLDSGRCTSVGTIGLLDSSDDAEKYVREAVLAYPELYFSRLVVLGEGDSEELVLPRLLASHSLFRDHLSVSVVPLGGRHVNHFWRLLEELEIPYVTLLDLDIGRHGGGWGRIRYARDQLTMHAKGRSGRLSTVKVLPKWDSAERPDNSELGKTLVAELEELGVFFSAPLDLDYTMLTAYPHHYTTTKAKPDKSTLVSVLGKSHASVDLYSSEEQALFDAYRDWFKRGSKPAAHLAAMSTMTDEQIIAGLPPTYARLLGAIENRLKELPE